MRDRDDNRGTETPQDQTRRKMMKKLAVGAGALAGYSMLPEQWTRPIVGQVALPAHAATSGVALHDPCTVTVIDGDQGTDTVGIRVDGYVSPPVANLAVLIIAEESETLITVTDRNGRFSGEMTIADGPGMTEIAVMTSVSDVDGISNCVVEVPAPAVVEVKAEPQQAAAQAEEPASPPAAGEEFNAREEYSLRWMAQHNRSFTWLNRTGAAYGGPIKFVFNNGCGELYVTNPVNDFNRGHPSAAVYFCGTKNKPEESNGNKASIFGPTGCRATKVTLFYNK
jgi:hypothetical protein